MEFNLETMLSIINGMRSAYGELIADEDVIENNSSVYYVRLEAKKEVLDNLMNEYNKRTK
jgi:hypothetical protein